MAPEYAAGSNHDQYQHSQRGHLGHLRFRMEHEFWLGNALGLRERPYQHCVDQGWLRIPHRVFEWCLAGGADLYQQQCEVLVVRVGHHDLRVGGSPDHGHQHVRSYQLRPDCRGLGHPDTHQGRSGKPGAERFLQCLLLAAGGFQRGLGPDQRLLDGSLKPLGRSLE